MLSHDCHELEKSSLLRGLQNLTVMCGCQQSRVPVLTEVHCLWSVFKLVTGATHKCLVSHSADRHTTKGPYSDVYDLVIYLFQESYSQGAESWEKEATAGSCRRWLRSETMHTLSPTERPPHQVTIVALQLQEHHIQGPHWHTSRNAHQCSQTVRHAFLTALKDYLFCISWHRRKGLCVKVPNRQVRGVAYGMWQMLEWSEWRHCRWWWCTFRLQVLLPYVFPRQFQISCDSSIVLLRLAKWSSKSRSIEQGLCCTKKWIILGSRAKMLQVERMPIIWLKHGIVVTAWQMVTSSRVFCLAIL